MNKEKYVIFDSHGNEKLVNMTSDEATVIMRFLNFIEPMWDIDIDIIHIDEFYAEDLP